MYRCLAALNATPGQLPLSLFLDCVKVWTQLQTKHEGMFWVFFFSYGREVLLFILKVPQFSSRKTQLLNKSFNKAVQLNFYYQPRPQQRLVL